MFCRLYAIVPTDPEQPCMGPFQVPDGNTLLLLKDYCKEDLGLEEHQYDLREILSPGEAFFDYRMTR